VKSDGEASIRPISIARQFACSVVGIADPGNEHSHPLEINTVHGQVKKIKRQKAKIKRQKFYPHPFAF
jgi:hypothetical protein